jgi:hypothetical protein
MNSSYDNENSGSEDGYNAPHVYNNNNNNGKGGIINVNPPMYDSHDRDSGGYSHDPSDDRPFITPTKKRQRDNHDLHSMHAHMQDAVVMFDRTWYVAILLVYSVTIGIMAMGQQHMGWTVAITTWVVIVAAGQLFSVVMSAYYWKKLALVTTSYKRSLHVITTSSQVYMLVLSIDAWWMLFYVPCTYAAYLESLNNIYAWNSFGIILVLMNVQLIVFVPQLLIFIFLNSSICRTGYKPTQDAD